MSEAHQFGRVPTAMVKTGIFARLTPAAHSVYLRLCADSNRNWTSSVGQRRIAQDMGLHIDTVNQAIRALQEAGLIESDDPGNGKRATYTITPNRSGESERSEGEPFGLSGQTVRIDRQNRSGKSEHDQRYQRNQSIPAACAAKPARNRDALWDALVAAFAINPVTKAERSRIGRIVRDLRLKAAAPEDIARRLDRYRAAWPKAADTPEALLKHWDRFAADHAAGNGSAGDRRTTSAELDAICPLVEPADEDFIAAYGDPTP